MSVAFGTRKPADTKKAGIEKAEAPKTAKKKAKAKATKK